MSSTGEPVAVDSINKTDDRPAARHEYEGNYSHIPRRAQGHLCLLDVGESTYQWRYGYRDHQCEADCGTACEAECCAYISATGYCHPVRRMVRRRGTVGYDLMW